MLLAVMSETFNGINALAFMAMLLVLGVALRARFTILQKALLPASLIGGVIGFVLINSDLSFGFRSRDYIVPAFHFFTLSFMALLLTGGEGGREESAARGGWWMTLGWLTIFVTQALVGLLVITGYKAAGGTPLSDFLGMAAPNGFCQGAGQAIAIGQQWQSQFQVDLAVNFGLIYASIGFFASFLIGVPAARWALRKGLHTNTLARLDEVYLRGIYPPGNRPSSGQQVTHPSNIDSFAFSLGILGVAYLLTDQFLGVMQQLTSTLTIGSVRIGVLFSHDMFFVHGMVCCLAMRAALGRVGYGHFIDTETMKRITGTAVDFMLIASILSVDFGLLAKFFVPIMLISVAGITVTAGMCYVFSRGLSKLRPERAITLFGIGMGTTGSGFLLLRMMDPNLSTTVARELAFFAVALTFVGTHLLYLLEPMLPSFSVATIVAIYGAHMVVGMPLWWWSARRA